MALVTDTVNVSMSPKDIEEQNRTEQNRTQDTNNIVYYFKHVN